MSSTGRDPALSEYNERREGLRSALQQQAEIRRIQQSAKAAIRRMEEDHANALEATRTDYEKRLDRAHKDLAAAKSREHRALRASQSSLAGVQAELATHVDAERGSHGVSLAALASSLREAEEAGREAGEASTGRYDRARLRYQQRLRNVVNQAKEELRERAVDHKRRLLAVLESEQRCHARLEAMTAEQSALHDQIDAMREDLVGQAQAAAAEAVGRGVLVAELREDDERHLLGAERLALERGRAEDLSTRVQRLEVQLATAAADHAAAIQGLEERLRTFVAQKRTELDALAADRDRLAAALAAAQAELRDLQSL